MSGDQWAADYEPVDERIRRFYADHPEGLLRSEIVWELTGPDRICIRGLAYRTPGELPATGLSWLAVPGGTPFTRGSEIENAETSAWGRALAALGYVGKRVASADELANKYPASAPGVAGPDGPGQVPAKVGPGARGGRKPSSPSGARSPAPPPRTEEEEALLSELVALPGMTKARMTLLANQVGAPIGQHATAAQLKAMLAVAGWPLPGPEADPRRAVSGGGPRPAVNEHDGAAAESPPAPAPSPDKVPA